MKQFNHFTTQKIGQSNIEPRIDSILTNGRNINFQPFQRNSFIPNKKSIKNPLVTPSEPLVSLYSEKPRTFMPTSFKEKSERFIQEKNKVVFGAKNLKNNFMNSSNSFVTTKVKQKLNDCNEQLQPRLTQQSKLNQKQSQLQAKFAAIKTHIISKLKEPSKKLEAVYEG